MHSAATIEGWEKRHNLRMAFIYATDLVLDNEFDRMEAISDPVLVRLVGGKIKCDEKVWIERILKYCDELAEDYPDEVALLRFAVEEYQRRETVEKALNLKVPKATIYAFIDALENPARVSQLLDEMGLPNDQMPWVIPTVTQRIKLWCASVPGEVVRDGYGRIFK